MKSAIIVYNHWNKNIITGGQAYEENMYECCKNNNTFGISRLILNFSTNYKNKIASPITNLKVLPKLIKHDLIIFNSSECIYLALTSLISRFILRKKTLIIHHHFIYLEFRGLKKLIYQFAESIFLRSASTILTPSPYIKSKCKEKYHNKNIILCPIPFIQTKNQLNQKPSKGELLYIGTIERRKGLIYLLKAFCKTKENGYNYNLTIIGKTIDKEYKSIIEDFIKTNSLSVTITGFISCENKNQIISKSDVFVFPSLLEGFGMVLCEAMEKGLPVICFDNSAMPYTVKNNFNGIIVPNKDITLFAEAIIKVVEDRDLREKLSKGAKKYASKLITPEKYKKLIITELNKII